MRQNRYRETRDICREEEAIFGGADCGGSEADRGGRTHRGTGAAGGISEQNFYRWKKQYAKLELDQLRQLRQLQEENQRLKRLVADLTLDKTMLQDVLAIEF